MKLKWRVDITGWDAMSRQEQRQLLELVGDIGGEWWGRGSMAFAEREGAQICYEVIHLKENARPRFIFSPDEPGSRG